MQFSDPEQALFRTVYKIVGCYSGTSRITMVSRPFFSAGKPISLHSLEDL